MAKLSAAALMAIAAEMEQTTIYGGEWKSTGVEPIPLAQYLSVAFPDMVKATKKGIKGVKSITVSETEFEDGNIGKSLKVEFDSGDYVFLRIGSKSDMYDMNEGDDVNVDEVEMIQLAKGNEKKFFCQSAGSALNDDDDEE